MATFTGLMDGSVSTYTYEVWGFGESWRRRGEVVDDEGNVYLDEYGDDFEPSPMYFPPIKVGEVKLPIPYFHVGNFKTRPRTGEWADAASYLWEEAASWYFKYLHRVIHNTTHPRRDAVRRVTVGAVSQALIDAHVGNYVPPVNQQAGLVRALRPISYSANSGGKPYAFSGGKPFLTRWRFDLEFTPRYETPYEISGTLYVQPPMKFAGVDHNRGPIFWVLGGMPRGLVVAPNVPKRVWSGGLGPETLFTHNMRLMPLIHPGNKKFAIRSGEVLVRLDEFEEQSQAL